MASRTRLAIMLAVDSWMTGVNQNVDVLRFSGQVDPRAIQPGNSVPSTQIANVRVEQLKAARRPCGKLAP